MTPAFRPRPEHELDGLSDDELIAHVRDARRAGDREQAVLALRILAFGHMRLVVARVRVKVPTADADDVAHDALARAITSSFDGSSVGEFRSWLDTIVRRAIVDYWRRRARRPAEVPLPDGEETWGDEPSTADRYPSVTGTSDGLLEDLVATVLTTMRPDHRRVIELCLIAGRPAGDAAAEIEGMTSGNVYKIVERFRRDVRSRLESQEAG